MVIEKQRPSFSTHDRTRGRIIKWKLKVTTEYLTGVKCEYEYCSWTAIKFANGSQIIQANI